MPKVSKFGNVKCKAEKESIRRVEKSKQNTVTNRLKYYKSADDLDLDEQDEWDV